MICFSITMAEAILAGIRRTAWACRLAVWLVSATDPGNGQWKSAVHIEDGSVKTFEKPDEKDWALRINRKTIP